MRKLFLALKIMKSHRVRYNPFVKRGEGCYQTFLIGNPMISINPFCEYFWETFIHEIGHHLCRRNDVYKKWSEYKKDTLGMNRNGENYGAILKEEAKATICGIRLSRASGVGVRRKTMLQWFYTYTGAGYKCLSKEGRDREVLTEEVVKLSKIIENA